MSAISSATSPVSEALPRTEWPAVLRDASIETFASMAGVTVVAPQDSDFNILTEVTGMVGIAGPLRAVFKLRCSLKAATTLSANMLGVSLEEAAAQKSDAVGEICNIIAGYFKAKIGLGDLCSLSVPTVLSGSNYQIHSPGQMTHMGLPLLYAEEPIWVSLDIRG